MLDIETQVMLRRLDLIVMHIQELLNANDEPEVEPVITKKRITKADAKQQIKDMLLGQTEQKPEVEPVITKKRIKKADAKQQIKDLLLGQTEQTPENPLANDVFSQSLQYQQVMFEQIISMMQPEENKDDSDFSQVIVQLIPLINQQIENIEELVQDRKTAKNMRKCTNYLSKLKLRQYLKTYDITIYELKQYIIILESRTNRMKNQLKSLYR